MFRAKYIVVPVVASLNLLACSTDEVEQTVAATPEDSVTTSPAVNFKPGTNVERIAASPGAAPYNISYKIIGTPIVGSPVTVDLRVDSALGPRPLRLDYRINDASSMLLSEAQPASVLMEPAANESSFGQQVTVIPQRDGRLYLNVSASFETEEGTMSTVAAIPIQVGTGSRELQEHGSVELDENGETVRVLSSE